MNIAEFFVRISADAKGVDAGVAQASTGLDRLSSLAKKAGVAMAAAFTVDKIFDFGRASVAEAASAEESWNRLAGTLRTVGVEFDTVAGQIDGVVASMQATSVLGDEDVADTLQTLVRISGDYAASLEQVRTVADVAAGANIDLQTAAELVGKAMAGQTGTLSRYGIVVKEGDDAMKLLQERFKGMSENEMNTLQGQLTQMNNAWGDFKEAVGEALLELSNGQNIIGAITDGIRDMTGWVERNREQVRLLGEGFVWLGTWAVKELAELVEEIKTINDHLSTVARWFGILRGDGSDSADALAAHYANLTTSITAGSRTIVTEVETVADVVTESVAAIDVAAVKAEAHIAKLEALANQSTLARKAEARTVKEAITEQREQFESFADTIADFAVSGKASMSDFVDSAIADLTRLAVRMAAMRFFELIIGGPAAALGGGTMNTGGSSLASLSPSIPAAASLAPSAPSASLSPAASPDVVAALNNRPRPMTPREAAQDEWWASFFSELYPVAVSRGLRTA